MIKHETHLNLPVCEIKITLSASLIRPQWTRITTKTKSFVSSGPSKDSNA